MAFNLPKFGGKQEQNPKNSNVVQFPNSNAQSKQSITSIAKKAIGDFNQKFGLAVGAGALAITGGGRD